MKKLIGIGLCLVTCFSAILGMPPEKKKPVASALVFGSVDAGGKAQTRLSADAQPEDDFEIKKLKVALRALATVPVNKFSSDIERLHHVIQTLLVCGAHRGADLLTQKAEKNLDGAYDWAYLLHKRACSSFRQKRELSENKKRSTGNQDVNLDVLDASSHY